MRAHQNVIVRPMPEGYPADCWIVTGAIYASEVRFYRTYEGALNYANKLAKRLEQYGCHVTVEERLHDCCQRVPVIEE